MRKRRRWRWPEGDYHVYNRGARRLRIFADDDDRSYFTHLIDLSARKYEIQVTSMSLMSNHFHMSLRADGAAMGEMLRDIERAYSRRFNERSGFSGALFEGRFGSVWLPDERALAYVTRYIHANCRDLGVAPEDYRWSTIWAYLGRTDEPDWLDTRRVLDYVGGRGAYRRYLAEVPPLRKGVSEEDRVQQAFVAHIAERVQEKIGNRTDLTLDTPARAFVAWVGVRSFALKPRVLARALGYGSGRSVSTMICRLDERLETAPELKRLLECS